MNRREDHQRERRVARLALGERNITERLVAVRSELDGLLHQIDRLALPPRRPAMHADTASSLAALPGLIYLAQQRRRRSK